MVDLEILIEGICTRPKLYDPNSDFYTIAAFIDGFVFANKATYDEMSDFNKWLSEKLKFPQNWMWRAGLQSKYPNNEDALRELLKLFREFRQSYIVV